MMQMNQSVTATTILKMFTIVYVKLHNFVNISFPITLIILIPRKNVGLNVFSDENNIQ